MERHTYLQRAKNFRMHYSKVVKKILINTINFLSAFGIDVVKLLRSIKNLPRFLLDYYRFQKLNDKKDNSKSLFILF